MDRLTPEQRHKNMQHIRNKDTKIEKVLRHELWKRNIRYRKNVKDLPGKPDIVITKYKLAIFADSEYFHGKDFSTVLKPQLEKGKNSEFWINKISKNIEHDDEINQKLKALGYTVIRFWGKDILKHTDECMKVIEETIFDLKIGDVDNDI